MTREYIEKLNAIEPYCFESDREEQWYNVGLKNGLEIADEHPKSPWISVKDDLPCNHKELIVGNLWTRVVIAFNGNNEYFDRMTMIEGKWYWQHYPQAKFWLLIPELPKE